MESEEIAVATNSFERHTQTALVLLLVALLLWVGNTTQTTAVSVAEMRVELAYLKAFAQEPPPHYLELSKRIDGITARLAHIEGEHENLINREK